MFGGFGIFDGSGAEEHFAVKSLPHSHDGAAFEVTCSTCGRTQNVIIEWQQIAHAAHSPHLPPGQQLPRDPVTGLAWQYDPVQKRMWPQVGCIQCRALVGPSITPDEAARILNEGITAGFVQARR